MHDTGFSGSYQPQDIQFLLRPSLLAFTEPAEKERLIQSGQRHYSEMLSEEAAPDAVQLQLFEQALTRNGRRMAADIGALALALAELEPKPIVLCSLVRAGVPVGVLLNRALKALGCDSHHYGLSIIRDKGLDLQALAHVMERHPHAQYLFVDGWTGKGAISRELNASLRHHPQFVQGPRLVTLADAGGKAWLSASTDDWLIPSGMLGATISGLVSRSLLSRDSDWHQCLDCQHLLPHDLSQSFIEQIDSLRTGLMASLKPARYSQAQRIEQAQWADASLQHIQQRYQVDNLNRLKPGIAEATRALLRRLPERLLVRDLEDPDLSLLRYLAEQNQLPIEVLGAELGPYRAMTLIQKVV